MKKQERLKKIEELIRRNTLKHEQKDSKYEFVIADVGSLAQRLEASIGQEEERISDKITEYFILYKRSFRKRGRTILFTEDDSVRLGKAIASDEEVVTIE